MSIITAAVFVVMVVAVVVVAVFICLKLHDIPDAYNLKLFCYLHYETIIGFRNILYLQRNKYCI